MAQSIIEDGEGGESVRAKLNDRWQVLAQSSVAVPSASDTAENILATITVPANSMGANGRIRVTTLWSYTSSANNKTLRVRFGGEAGTAYTSSTSTTTASARFQTEICNRGSASSQVGGMPGSGGWSTSANTLPSSTVDTSSDAAIIISGQKALAGEALTLEGYIVELLRAL